jgi:hypothetical protein
MHWHMGDITIRLHERHAADRECNVCQDFRRGKSSSYHGLAWPGTTTEYSSWNRMMDTPPTPVTIRDIA